MSLSEAGNRVAAAKDPTSGSDTLATPECWSFAGSLSEKFTFVGSQDVDKKLRFLRTEGGLDVYLNLDTGKEVFLGRTA